MNKRGFTLIELLVVITIIGILAAVAVTGYIGVTKKAARSEAYATLESIRLLEEQFFAENAAYTASAATGPAIRVLLPGFNPGGNPPGTGIYFTYAVTQNIALTPPVAVPFGGATVVQTPCFVATATGVLGTRVCPNAADCDVFAIDCNNNRNF